MGNETVELDLVRYFNSLAGWLRGWAKLQAAASCGSKTRSSIHSSSGPPNKTWTSSWLSNVCRKLEQHEASLVRVIFLPSTERPLPPAIAKESWCQPGRRNLRSSSQSNTTIFRAALPLHGNWMSSEEFVGACRLPLPT